MATRRRDAGVRAGGADRLAARLLGVALRGRSSALELIYLVLLATAYSVAAMGFVYPIARGSAPVLVLDRRRGRDRRPRVVPAAIGVVLVAAGILLVRGVAAGRAPPRPRARPLGRRVHRRLHAGRQARDHPCVPARLPEVVFGLTATVYVLGAWRVRGGPRCAPRSAGRPCSPASASSAPTPSRWLRCGWRRRHRWPRCASRAW